MVLRRHFVGCATSGAGVLELVYKSKPNILAFSDDLQGLSVDSLICQSKQIQLPIRTAVFVTTLNGFSGFRDCPIVVA